MVREGQARWDPRRVWPVRLRTVRAKLTVLAASVVAAVLAVSAVGLVVVQRTLLTDGIDEALVQRADNIEGEIAAGRYGSLLPSEGDPEDSFLQVLGPDGQLLAASGNVRSIPPVTTPVTGPDDEVLRTVRAVPLPDQGTHEFRVLVRRLDDTSGRAALVVGKNLDDVNESVGILVSSLAIAIPLVTATLAVLLWWLIGRVLRPVEVIRAEVSGIQASALHRRVPVPGTQDEIARLARTMNEMLDRLEQATLRQRQFVADASHELRSPLTRIRSALEVGLAHPDTVDPGTAYPSLLADTADLQKLVDDLLYLARSESGELATSTTSVDLDDIVLAEAQRLRERGAVGVDTSRVGPARTHGDPGQLARVVRNLASNAERHAASRVTFVLREDGEHSELEVCDDGYGIPPEHHGTVFKRFARLDDARSRDAGGSGLGLAIVHDVVSRHHGTVTIASADCEGARFVVSLPRVD